MYCVSKRVRTKDFACVTHINCIEVYAFWQISCDYYLYQSTYEWIACHCDLIEQQKIPNSFGRHLSFQTDYRLSFRTHFRPTNEFVTCIEHWKFHCTGFSWGRAARKKKWMKRRRKANCQNRGIKLGNFITLTNVRLIWNIFSCHRRCRSDSLIGLFKSRLLINRHLDGWILSRLSRNAEERCKNHQ